MWFGDRVSDDDEEKEALPSQMNDDEAHNDSC